MSKSEFCHEVKARGFDEEDAPTHKVFSGEIEPCVGIVWAAQEILGLSDEEADGLEEAGFKDARERMKQTA